MQIKVIQPAACWLVVDFSKIISPLEDGKLLVRKDAELDRGAVCLKIIFCTLDASSYSWFWPKSGSTRQGGQLRMGNTRQRKSFQLIIITIHLIFLIWPLNLECKIKLCNIHLI